MCISLPIFCHAMYVSKIGLGDEDTYLKNEGKFMTEIMCLYVPTYIIMILNSKKYFPSLFTYKINANNPSPKKRVMIP